MKKNLSLLLLLGMVLSGIAPVVATAQQLYTVSPNPKNVWTPNGWAYPNSNYSYTAGTPVTTYTTPAPLPTQIYPQSYPASFPQITQQAPQYYNPTPLYSYAEGSYTYPAPQITRVPYMPSTFGAGPMILSGTFSMPGQLPTYNPASYALLSTFSQSYGSGCSSYGQASYQLPPIMPTALTYQASPCGGYPSLPPITTIPQIASPTSFSGGFTFGTQPLLQPFTYPSPTQPAYLPPTQTSPLPFNPLLQSLQLPSTPYHYMSTIQPSLGSGNTGQNVYSVETYDLGTGQLLYSYATSAPITPQNTQVYPLSQQEGYYYFSN